MNFYKLKGSKKFAKGFQCINWRIKKTLEPWKYTFLWSSSLHSCQVKNVISPPFQKHPPRWRALHRGGSFFRFFRSYFVGWVQKNFWLGFGILLMFRPIFLVVCLFPAKIWPGQKNFQQKNAFFGQNDQL